MVAGLEDRESGNSSQVPKEARSPTKIWSPCSQLTLGQTSDGRKLGSLLSRRRPWGPKKSKSTSDGGPPSACARRVTELSSPGRVSAFATKSHKGVQLGMPLRKLSLPKCAEKRRTFPGSTPSRLCSSRQTCWMVLWLDRSICTVFVDSPTLTRRGKREHSESGLQNMNLSPEAGRKGTSGRKRRPCPWRCRTKPPNSEARVGRTWSHTSCRSRRGISWASRGTAKETWATSPSPWAIHASTATASGVSFDSSAAPAAALGVQLFKQPGQDMTFCVRNQLSRQCTWKSPHAQDPLAAPQDDGGSVPAAADKGQQQRRQGWPRACRQSAHCPSSGTSDFGAQRAESIRRAALHEQALAQNFLLGNDGCGGTRGQEFCAAMYSLSSRTVHDAKVHAGISPLPWRADHRSGCASIAGPDL
mmetsp:Transcript_82688/g.267711  ORF Transcript_82688/g.267711 Transcript_82688/m.267711 type:complete len:417 (-) Transcript_82688:38-1288(-)